MALDPAGRAVAFHAGEECLQVGVVEGFVDHVPFGALPAERTEFIGDVIEHGLTEGVGRCGERFQLWRQVRPAGPDEAVPAHRDPVLAQPRDGGRAGLAIGLPHLPFEMIFDHDFVEVFENGSAVAVAVRA